MMPLHTWKKKGAVMRHPHPHHPHTHTTLTPWHPHQPHHQRTHTPTQISRHPPTFSVSCPSKWLKKIATPYILFSKLEHAHNITESMQTVAQHPHTLFGFERWWKHERSSASCCLFIIVIAVYDRTEGSPITLALLPYSIATTVTTVKSEIHIGYTAGLQTEVPFIKLFLVTRVAATS